MKKRLSIIATTAALALTSILCVYAATNDSEYSTSACSCGAEINYICGGNLVYSETNECHAHKNCTYTTSYFDTICVCSECKTRWVAPDRHPHMSDSTTGSVIPCPFSSAIASVGDIAD